MLLLELFKSADPSQLMADHISVTDTHIHVFEWEIPYSVGLTSPENGCHGTYSSDTASDGSISQITIELKDDDPECVIHEAVHAGQDVARVLRLLKGRTTHECEEAAAYATQGLVREMAKKLYKS